MSIIQVILGFLLDYVLDLCCEPGVPDFALIDALIVHLCTLTHQFPVPASVHIMGHLSKRQEAFTAACGSKAWRGVFPSFDTVRSASCVDDHRIYVPLTSAHRFKVMLGQVWGHTPEQRVSASTLRRY